MVKSDALFSYIPPTNILGWLLTPLRYVMPFHSFVKLNRTIIKVTHLPLLWIIFAYERLILSRLAYEPTELVEQRGRGPSRLPAFSIRGPDDLFSPGPRLREPSVTTFHKDKALEEVFRRPLKSPPLDDRSRRGSVHVRAKTANVVQDWMRGVGQQGGAASPDEQSRSVVDRLENRRSMMRRSKASQPLPIRRRDTTTKSDPELVPLKAAASTSADATRTGYGFPNMSLEDLPQQTDADGDDELATNEEDDRPTYERSFLETEENESDKENSRPRSNVEGEYFRTPKPTRETMSPAADSSISQIRPLGGSSLPPPTPQRINPPKRENMHARNASSATILFSPLEPKEGEDHEPSLRSVSPKRQPRTETIGPKATSRAASPRKSAKRKHPTSSTPTKKPRSTFPPYSQRNSTPNLAAFLALDRRKPSFSARALDLASDLGDNRYRPDAAAIGVLPASFGTELEMAAYWRRRRGRMLIAGDSGDDEEEDEDGEGKEATRRLSRIMLQRMSNLEEGFREVLREVKKVSKAGSVEDEDVPKPRKGKREKRSPSRKAKLRNVESDREDRRRLDASQGDQNGNETAATRTSV